MEIWLDIANVEKQLDNALSTIRKNGIAYAEAERDYRIAKAKKILELKSQGFPTTLIPDLAKGDEVIADLDLKRNILEATYKANRDGISVKMLELSVLKVQYEKEYVATK